MFLLFFKPPKSTHPFCENKILLATLPEKISARVLAKKSVVKKMAWCFWNSPRDNDASFLVKLVGDGGTGKSTFARRFSEDERPKCPGGGPRHGYPFKVAFQADSTRVTLHVQDTNGAEKLGALRDEYL